MPPSLHRHQLAWISPAGWQRVLARPRDDEALDGLKHWAAAALPLVVTRQPPGGADASGGLALGLSAPDRWQRRRIALQVPQADVLAFGEFPRLDELWPDGLPAASVAVRRLDQRLRQLGLQARVYGSHGWQHFSGLNHVRPGSDLDLWVAVSGIDQADAAAAVVSGFAAPALRVDGELVFGGDRAVAWREWLAWREGRTKALLVKRLSGASMAASLAEFDDAAPAEAP